MMHSRRLVSVVGLVVAMLAGAYAQDSGAASSSQNGGAAAGPRLTFEVISIKPSAPATGGRGGGRANIPLTPGDRYTPNDGYVTLPGVTALRLIAFAYAMDANPDPELNALPDWAKNERFDITAKAAHPGTKDEMRAMVKSMLEDRFGMVMHIETRNMNAFVLVMSKPGHFGPQMRVHVDEGLPCENQPGAPGAVAAPAASPETPAAGGTRGGGGGRGGARATPDGFPVMCGDLTSVPDAPPGRSRLGGRNVTMATFMSTARGGMDRPVVDQTGLTGRYDWWIEYVPDAATDGQYGANFPNPDPTGLKLWQAFKEQLGLELKPVKTDVPWMVFDHLERPTAN